MTREELAREIAVLLHSHGHQVFLVGGCVRDGLLGLAPKDYDLATDATPQQLINYFPRAQLVGAHFGVILVTADPPDVHVEVATFRSEGAYSDGRRPDQVQFERDPRLDARRRDFTINGMMQDPLRGEILDFVGGQADLAAGFIRAIGEPDRRFTEDYLRMLRAVRFAARFDFQIEAATLQAIQKNAPLILHTSAERTRDELVRMLTEGNAARALVLLDQTRLLAVLLPEVKAFQGVPQPPEYHPEGDVWTHVLLMLARLDHPTPTLAWGTLLHDVGKPPTFARKERIRFDGHAEVGARMADAIMNRLKASTEDSEQVVSLVAHHMRFKDVEQMRLSTLKRFLRLPRFDEHLALHRLDTMASNGYTAAYEYVQEKLAEFSRQELRPPRLLTGNDLIAAGYRPGPGFSQALEAVETAQLDGQIHSRDEALLVAAAVLEKLASPTSRSDE